MVAYLVLFVCSFSQWSAMVMSLIVEKIHFTFAHAHVCFLLFVSVAPSRNPYNE